MKKLSPFALFLMLCMLFACTGEKRTEQMDAKACLEAGKAALASDSIRQGETLLRKAISKAEESGDWHTCYLAYQQLAQSLSWSNSEKAFSLAKKAVAVYERHPDDERNHIILLTLQARMQLNWHTTPKGIWTKPSRSRVAHII